MENVLQNSVSIPQFMYESCEELDDIQHEHLKVKEKRLINSFAQRNF